MNKADRIAYLREQIALADDAYWSLGISGISDAEYDKLVEELKDLTGHENQFKSPVVVSGGKVTHTKPMLSMQKVYDIEGVLKWYKRNAAGERIVVMPKYDGIAYVNYGSVVATRGDGKVGEDITETAMLTRTGFQSLLPYSSPEYGEIICRKSEFERLKEFGYKNPRNAVSGIMNSLDPEIRKRASHLELVKYTSTWHCISPYEFCEESVQDVIDWILKNSADYPMDGIVFRIADSKAFAKLGHTDHHWRGQIALKFANESTESVIEAIEWQENNGTITPVAHIAPVTLGGAEISSVTLHNMRRVVTWDIRVGDRCKVERAGGVVPKITDTWHEAHDGFSRTECPTVCPTCKTPLQAKGARVYCPACDK
jgi:DNA ligase (NAD+)